MITVKCLGDGIFKISQKNSCFIKRHQLLWDKQSVVVRQKQPTVWRATQTRLSFSFDIVLASVTFICDIPSTGIVISQFSVARNVSECKQSDPRNRILYAHRLHKEVRFTWVVDKPSDVSDVRSIDVGCQQLCTEKFPNFQNVVVRRWVCILRSPPYTFVRQQFAGIFTHETAPHHRLQRPHADASAAAVEHLQLDGDAALDDTIEARLSTSAVIITFQHRPQ